MNEQDTNSPVEGAQQSNQVQQASTPDPKAAAGGCGAIIVLIVLFLIYVGFASRYDDDELFKIGKQMAVLYDASMVLRGDPTISEYLNDPATSALLTHEWLSKDELRYLEVEASVWPFFADDNHRKLAEVLHEKYDTKLSWRNNEDYVAQVKEYMTGILIATWKYEKLAIVVTRSEAENEVVRLREIIAKKSRGD